MPTLNIEKNYFYFSERPTQTFFLRSTCGATNWNAPNGHSGKSSEHLTKPFKAHRKRLGRNEMDILFNLRNKKT